MVREPFSSRFHWELRPNALARLLDRKQREGAAVLDLTESNPTRAGLEYAENEILRAIAHPDSLLYQPHPAGLDEARQAVANYYASRGRRVAPGHVLLTASTSEAYAYLFKLLADPGDEILAPRPSYPLFEFLAALESVRIVHYPLAYHEGWWLELEALRKAVTERTRALVVVNPNNPTGSFLKRDELEGLVRLCAGRGLAIISDEVFADYVFGADERRVETLAEVSQVLTFVLSGLSKIAGLPQMKLGWLLVGGPAADRSLAIERLELIADTYLSVGTPVQRATRELLRLREAFQNGLCRRLRENLELLESAIRSQSACRLLEVEGGWYATLQLPRTRTEEEWGLALLDEHDVLVQPGYFYDFESEAFVVVSLLTRPEVFREGVRRLLELAS